MNSSYCICGATDCKFCGPAQGYEIRKKWVQGRGWVYYNPDEEDGEEQDDYDIDEPRDYE